eukprot:1342721-Rhodomonas_salina.1
MHRQRQRDRETEERRRDRETEETERQRKERDRENKTHTHTHTHSHTHLGGVSARGAMHFRRVLVLLRLLLPRLPARAHTCTHTHAQTNKQTKKEVKIGDLNAAVQLGVFWIAAVTDPPTTQQTLGFGVVLPGSGVLGGAMKQGGWPYDPT